MKKVCVWGGDIFWRTCVSEGGGGERVTGGILRVPLQWELGKVSICVILRSLMPAGFLFKYMLALKFNGVTGMLSVAPFQLDRPGVKRSAIKQRAAEIQREKPGITRLGAKLLNRLAYFCLV